MSYAVLKKLNAPCENKLQTGMHAKQRSQISHHILFLQSHFCLFSYKYMLTGIKECAYKTLCKRRIIQVHRLRRKTVIYQPEGQGHP